MTRERPETSVDLDQLDAEDRRVTAASPENEDPQVSAEKTDNVDPPAPREALDLQDHPDHQDHEDPRVNEVSVVDPVVKDHVVLSPAKRRSWS